MTRDELVKACEALGWLDESRSEMYVSFRRTFPAKGRVPDHARVMYGMSDGLARVAFCVGNAAWKFSDPVRMPLSEVVLVLKHIERMIGEHPSAEKPI